MSELFTPHRKIWDPLYISGTMRDRKLKFYTRLGKPSTLSSYENFSARGRVEGGAPPSVNLGLPHISETTRARKLKFYTHLDGAKYPFQV